MQVKLTMAELSEAVREWCSKRGMDIDGLEVEFTARHIRGDEYEFNAHIAGVQLPPYFGPYR